jgi:hypothetical protein
MSDLEARRRVLLHRCEEQRIELAYRVAQIRPAAQLTAWTRRGPQSVANNPLAWLAGLASLLLLVRRRGGLLGGVGWITGLVALASRATTLLRLFAQLRAVYLGMKSQPKV